MRDAGHVNAASRDIGRHKYLVLAVPEAIERGLPAVLRQVAL
jgi:hypothetical protein